VYWNQVYVAISLSIASNSAFRRPFLTLVRMKYDKCNRIHKAFHKVTVELILLLSCILIQQDCIYVSSNEAIEIPSDKIEDTMKQVSFRGSFLGKGECVKFAVCKQRCYSYALGTVRGLNSNPGIEGYIDATNTTRKKIAADTHLCYLGCCFRSGANYDSCANSCHKFSATEKRSTQFRWFHLCTKGCFHLCPSSSSHNTMAVIAPNSDDPQCNTNIAPSFSWGRSANLVLPDAKIFNNYVDSSNKKLASRARRNQKRL